MKKTNNQGFSLVELIIVIAIMAVLIGVLAPQFLTYVDKSREQKDDSAIGEVSNAIEVALATEAIYNEITTGVTGTVTITDTATGTTCVVTYPVATPPGTALLQAELTKVIGTIDFTSKRYANNTVTIPVTTAGVGTATLPVDPTP